MSSTAVSTVPWMRATVVIANGSRFTRSLPLDPECGPVPVTTVPVTIASAVSATSSRPRARTGGATTLTSRLPSGSRARWTSSTASATSAWDRIMCPITNGGHRCDRTTMPPSTIWPTTPATNPNESHVRSRRRGRRTSAPSTASTTASDTRPVTSRFPNSTQACQCHEGYTWFD